MGRYSAALPSTFVLLLFCFAMPSKASLLPFAVPLTDLWPDKFPDPFRILEHAPFGIERDESAALPLARVDWKETPDSHIMKLDVPGLRKDELKVEIEENRAMRVSGERKREEEKKGDRWHSVERFYGKFWRQFKLPENVDLDSVGAKLDSGVLTLCFSKLAPEKPKDTKVISIAGEEGKPAEIKSSEAKQEL